MSDQVDELSEQRVRLNARIKELEEQKESAMDALNYAWTIICNVSEGDWTKQTQEWQDAAARLREQYHALLDSRAYGQREVETDLSDVREPDWEEAAEQYRRDQGEGSNPASEPTTMLYHADGTPYMDVADYYGASNQEREP